MKKIKMFLLFVCISFCITSCREEKNNSEKAESSTEKREKSVNIQKLTSLDIVTNYSQFSDVTDIQSWNFETDMNRNTSPSSGIADIGDTTYINNFNSLIKFPKGEYSANIACEKPDCQHVIPRTKDNISVYPDADMACRADLSIGENIGYGLQYYDGYLYYMIKDGGIALCRISSDGKIKSQIALLSDKSSGEETPDMPWLIHRENVYFWNEKEGICRVALRNPASKDVIIERQKGTYIQPILKAYGSFLYFVLPGSEDNTWIFCRYNEESGQIEQFPELNGRINNFVVREDKIYYQRYQENTIYEYNIDSGENAVFFELENRDFSFYADADYICLPKSDSAKGKNGDYDISADVYTWDKAYIGVIQLEKKSSNFNETIHIIGSDSDRIFYRKEVTEEKRKREMICYINKSDISKNGTMIKIAYESMIN